MIGYTYVYYRGIDCNNVCMTVCMFIRLVAWGSDYSGCAARYSISALRMLSADVCTPELLTTDISSLLLLVSRVSRVLSYCSPCVSHKL